MSPRQGGDGSQTCIATCSVPRERSPFPRLRSDICRGNTRARLRHRTLHIMSERPPSRQVFFSFDYNEDRNRADVVCESWQMHHADSMVGASFVDSGIWQKAKALSDENVKRLIREGIGQTAVTCVLVG